MPGPPGSGKETAGSNDLLDLMLRRLNLCDYSRP